MELFIEGAENPLPNAARLDSLGLEDRAVLFMLLRQSTCGCVATCIG
jgi:hypothetical protein